MKKILFLSSIIMIIMASTPIKAQYPKLEVKATAISESQPGKSDAQIQLVTEGERPPYVYQLFDKAPWNGGKELARSEKTSEIQYTFKNLSPGNYFVCVTDSEESSDCEIIQIK